jgi:hypothetical protein
VGTLASLNGILQACNSVNISSYSYTLIVQIHVDVGM